MARRITVIKPSEVYKLIDRSISLSDGFSNNQHIDNFDHSSIVKINVYTSTNNIYVLVSVPGFLKEEIDISFKDNKLIITGEKQDDQVTDKMTSFLKEFKIESFAREITLEGSLDIENTDAKLNNGIMEITIPKLIDTLKKIPIQ